MRKLDYNHLILDRIYRTYHPLLHAYALKLCKNEHQPDMAADDLIQDFYEKLLRKWHKIEQGYNQYGKNYLFGVMKHAYIDNIRSEERRVNRQYFYTIGEPTTCEIELQPSKNSDTFPAYVHAILSKIEYKVLEYQVLKEWNYQKIADYLSIPKNTVGTHLRRAKLKLREALEA